MSWVLCPSTRLTLVGVSRTDATAIALTVTAAVVDLPSLVAVTLAAPGATAVTWPVLSTMATDALLLRHDTTRPDSAAPFASTTVEFRSPCCPTVSSSSLGDSRTAATGVGATVSVATALFPCSVAAMLALPTLSAVTTPFCETVATATSLLDQKTPLLEIVLPAPSRTVTSSGVLLPTPSVSVRCDSSIALIVLAGGAVASSSLPPQPRAGSVAHERAMAIENRRARTGAGRRTHHTLVPIIATSATTGRSAEETTV